jgi:hypothetical protein
VPGAALQLRGLENKKKRETYMKRIVSGVLCGVALAGFSIDAAAVPVYFDFTGSITETNGTFANSGLEGTSISGGFAFDTENLSPLFSPDLGLAQFFEWPMLSSQASANFGGGSVSFPVYSPDNIINVVFADTNCTPAPFCQPAWPYFEGFNIFTLSRDVDLATFTAPGYVGTVHESQLSIATSDYDPAHFATYIDWETAGPIDITTLPMPNIGGVFVNTVYSCDGGPYCISDQVGYFNFTIDSVSRGVVQATSVPEPGTLGLSVAAGFGLLLFGRRRRSTAIAAHDGERP